MKKSLLLLASSTLIATAAFIGYKICFPFNPNIIYGKVTDHAEKEEEEPDGYDGAAARNKWEFDRIKDPATGTVPAERLTEAVRYTAAAKQSLTFRTQGGGVLWTERGPDYDLVGPGGNGRPGGGYTSGRIRAIHIDLSDATKKTVWVGGICGGIWKTTDVTASPATWALINDQFQNMAVSSICQDPVNTNVMYFGTGEKTYNFDRVRGAGIWKSTDGGGSWSQLLSTTGFYNISKIACDALGNVYVAGIGNSVGIRRSVDGGANWTIITPTGLSSNVTDFDISSTGRLHVVCGYYDSAIEYRYTTTTAAAVTSATWATPATTFTNNDQYNCDITSSGNTVYALPSDVNDETPFIYKSTDGGLNWAPTTTAPAGTLNNAISSGQGWYNMALAADQTNANNVLAGGLNAYRSIDGGATWSQASVWASGVSGTVTNYVHADQQAAIWDGSRLLVASDGGLFYSSNNGVTFGDRNRGLRLKQFYSCAIYPTAASNYLLAGAQDNGVHQLTNAGLSFSTEVTGGDGAFVDISSTNGNLQFGSYVFNDYYRSTNGGTSWTEVNFSNSGRFINPFDYDELSNAVYACHDTNTILRWSNPSVSNTSTTFTVSGLGEPTAVVASPYTTGSIYAGSSTGKVYKITGANTASGSADATATNIGSTSFPSGTVSCIAIGTNESNIAVIISNYGVNNIWQTTNGGATWIQIDGNLPDMPVRWGVFPTGINTSLIVATEAGVYSSGTINGASTVWTPSPGFPTVRTDMLKIRASDGTLVAATHGRGLWTSTVLQVLPLHNLLLKGSTEASGKALLSWTSMDAGPQARFHLQFSKNGIDFSEVADLSYNVLITSHQMPVAQGYYRVVGVEPNAAPVISNVVLLRNNNGEKSMQLVVAPNPVRNNATLLLSGTDNGTYQWQLCNVTGQTIKSGSGSSLRNTTESLPLNVGNLPSGQYWIRLTQGKNLVSASFINE